MNTFLISKSRKAVCNSSMNQIFLLIKSGYCLQNRFPYNSTFKLKLDVKKQKFVVATLPKNQNVKIMRLSKKNLRMIYNL